MTKTKSKKTPKAKTEATNKSDDELDDLEGDALDSSPDDIASAEPDKDGDSDGTDGPTTTKADKRPGDDDDDDEPDPDDVEADLDTILKDRIAAADDEDDEEDGVEFGSSAGARTPPKTESEFVCRSCFLVKSVTQRVDGSDDLCMDCV